MTDQRTKADRIARPWVFGLVVLAAVAAACTRTPPPVDPEASAPERAGDAPGTPDEGPTATPDAPGPVETPATDAAAVPPEPAVTTVPEVPVGPCTDDPSQCTVTLRAPAAGRMVIYRVEGVTLSFGFGDFLTLSRDRGEDELVAYLDGLPADQNPVRLGATPGPPTNRWQFVVAELLDRGRARVHDEAGDRDVESIVRETWDWMGCGGGCRQSGRQYRLQVPGDVFYRVTDLYEDGEPGTFNP